MKRRIFSFLTAFVLLLNLGSMALAATVDLTEEGSITVDMRYHYIPVPGGDLTLYRVGEVALENGEYGFRPTDDFADYQGSFEDIESPELPEELSEYARQHRIKGETQSIGIDGSVTFEGLTPDLYLLVQHNPAPGYYPVNPFLVSIPHLENGEYNYHVDASPKVEPEPVIPTVPTCPSEPTEPSWPSEPTEPSGPTEPTEPSGPSEPTDPSNPSEPTEPSGPSEPTGPSNPFEPTEPSNPSEPTGPATPDTPTTPPVPDQPGLPDTGQLNWPIPVMALMGLTLFIIGWALCFRKRDDRYEE